MEGDDFVQENGLCVIDTSQKEMDVRDVRYIRSVQERELPMDGSLFDIQYFSSYQSSSLVLGTLEEAICCTGRLC
jgi:ribosome biogenesis protein Tsr3